MVPLHLSYSDIDQVEIGKTAFLKGMFVFCYLCLKFYEFHVIIKLISSFQIPLKVYSILISSYKIAVM